MKTKRLGRIEDVELIEKIWQFYYQVFCPVNTETPRVQTWPKQAFIALLKDPEVVKIVAIDNDEIAGIGIITDKMSADPWLSVDYFEKYFPGSPVFNILCLAIDIRHRKSRLAIQLLKEMLIGLPHNGVGVFFVSDNINNLLPKMAERAMNKTIVGRPMDHETCWIYRMKDMPFPDQHTK